MTRQQSYQNYQNTVNTKPFTIEHLNDDLQFDILYIFITTL